MTKPVTAACAAQLVSEGKLDLRAPLSAYIPEFAQPATVRTLKPGSKHKAPHFPPNAPRNDDQPEPEFDYAPARRPITVHDIMSFTSGLQTIMVDNPTIPEIGPQDTLASHVAKLGGATLEFQPGAQWHYSNVTGYDVLGRLIEIVSGRPFDRYAQELLFDPLGMKDTGFGLPRKDRGRTLSVGFFEQMPIARNDYPSGSAGLWSTAVDYQHFAQMLLQEGMFGGRRILQPEAVASMHRNQIGDLPFAGVRSSQYAQFNAPPQPGIRYGYGVAIIEGASAEPLPTGSFGWDGIGTRRFWVIPSLDAVLVMLMPGLGPHAEPVHREIEAALAT